MKIVIALDSFKGSCSAMVACAAVAQGLRRVRDDLILIEMPVSDGGEGLLVTLADSPQLNDLSWQQQQCIGPYGKPVTASMLRHSGGLAVLEMAESCGLELTPIAEREASRASSYGLGEQLKAALDLDCRHFIIGLGGSASNDGGMGFAQALGVKFIDSEGVNIAAPATGLDLSRVAQVNLSGLDPRLQESVIEASCDVSNPLLGEQGATWVYGRQKGADDSALTLLEAGMVNYNRCLSQALGRDVSGIPGAGAAGGMGAALLAYTPARLSPGIDLVLSLLSADDHLTDASLVFVGEGRLDKQSAFGKAPVGVARAAARHSVPVIALCGERDDSSQQLYQHHINAMWPICSRPMSLAESMANSEKLLADAAENALRTFLAGRQQVEISHR